MKIVNMMIPDYLNPNRVSKGFVEEIIKIINLLKIE